MSSNGSSDGTTVPKYVSPDGVFADLFDALSHHRRRFVLHVLRDGNEPMSLETLGAYTAAWERDQSPENVADEHVERVSASLYHAHLPKLREKNLVEFDRAERVVSLADGEATEQYRNLTAALA
ncbi:MULTISPECIES: DUF7344 domain-containing protein [Halorussus]|uniref:DUF7344 domain-containing protein n=1 Tax=Halorussus TaxID=1070314 RepID=UPI0020A099FC|nr:hypothetical protein [Halorussus vallis]USZ76719.1 hypothetical protein NGM07_05180 [Halorussus vallis]